MKDKATPFLFESDDIPEYGAMFKGPWELINEQLQPGRAQMRARGVTVGTDAIYEEQGSRTRAVFGELHAGTLVLMIPDEPTRAGRFWGTSCPESTIIIGRSNREVDVTLPDYRAALVILREDEFRRHYREATGREPAVLDGRNFLRLPPAKLAALRAAWRRLATGVTTIPPGFSLCRSVAEALAVADPATGSAVTTATRRARAVREAIDLLKDSDYQLSLADVSERLDVNQRTLRNWFHAHTSQSPSQYLLHHRLNSAHRDLAAADPSRCTVTEIAMRHGFFDLGRFAMRFRHLFGRRPSEVLGRPRHPAPRQLRFGAAA